VSFLGQSGSGEGVAQDVSRCDCGGFHLGGLPDWGMKGGQDKGTPIMGAAFSKNLYERGVKKLNTDFRWVLSNRGLKWRPHWIQVGTGLYVQGRDLSKNELNTDSSLPSKQSGTSSRGVGSRVMDSHQRKEEKVHTS